ncbi:ubiquitin-like with PHD and RING finger domains 2 [Orbilia oligospora]|uniref:Ubiquitin-like with PHD and RING finger domains 2 n=1 Tax=Orbilia oligospora TaxID=2813651 RepID=A0A7C8Q3N8_ORBOL|nr:ubiquitin-like with PHD and RING finger domains 2 [Orbilia oligospora]
MDSPTFSSQLPLQEHHIAVLENSSNNGPLDETDSYLADEILSCFNEDSDGITAGLVWKDPSQSEQTLSDVIVNEIKRLRQKDLVAWKDLNVARDLIVEMIGQPNSYSFFTNDLKNRPGQFAKTGIKLLRHLKERVKFLGDLPQTRPIDDVEIEYINEPPPSRSHEANVVPQKPKVPRPQPVQTSFGYVAGINIGDSWKRRKQITDIGLHCRPQGSVHGRKQEGVFSLIIAGAYKEDRNSELEITFTGVGGFDEANATKKVAQGSKLSIDDLTSGPKASNTENCALAMSASTGKPIRVIANPDANLSFCRKARGFTFIGLWKVSGSLVYRNKKNVDVLRFQLSPFDEQTRTYVLKNIQTGPKSGPSNVASTSQEIVLHFKVDDDSDD